MCVFVCVYVCVCVCVFVFVFVKGFVRHLLFTSHTHMHALFLTMTDLIHKADDDCRRRKAGGIVPVSTVCMPGVWNVSV